MEEVKTFDILVRGISEDVLEQLDRIAEADKRSRTAEILVAIEFYLAKNKVSK